MVCVNGMTDNWSFEYAFTAISLAIPNLSLFKDSFKSDLHSLNAIQNMMK